MAAPDNFQNTGLLFEKRRQKAPRNENGIRLKQTPDSEPLKTWKIHIYHTCGNGNQASDNGNETAEKDCIVSFAVELGHGFECLFQTKSFFPTALEIRESIWKGKQFSSVQKNSSADCQSHGKVKARYVQQWCKW